MGEEKNRVRCEKRLKSEASRKSGGKKVRTNCPTLSMQKEYEFSLEYIFS